MLKEILENRYLMLLVIVLLGASLVAGLFYILTEKKPPKLDKTNCPTCGSETPKAKIKNIAKNTFKETVQFSAVATSQGSNTKYFNWRPGNFCPENKKCYLKNITAKVTFLNTGTASISSKEGAAYIQIASSKESNCQDPHQATFTRYLAYSPALAGGESWTKDTCGESVTPNTCDLTAADNFDNKSNCFSIKLFAPSQNDGEVLFATHLLFLTYTYETQ